MGVRDEAMRQRIRDQYEITQSHREIAKALNLTVPQVQWSCRSMNLPNVRVSKIKWIDDDHIECSKCSKKTHVDKVCRIRPNGPRPSMLSYCRDCRTKQIVKNNRSSLTTHLKRRVVSLRTRAKSKNLPFNLTLDDLQRQYDKQQGLCFYTDEILVLPDLDSSKNSLSRNRLSVDKVIPSLGYVSGNIVLCTSRANNIKANCTLEELEAWLPSWYERLFKR